MTSSRNTPSTVYAEIYLDALGADYRRRMEMTPGSTPAVSSMFKSRQRSIKSEILRRWHQHVELVQVVLEATEIDTIVSLSLGSFYAQSSILDIEKWMYELAFTHALAEIILRKSGRQPRMYFQDIAFTDDDKAILTEMGGTIITHPDANAVINDKTIVFGLCIPLDVVASVVCQRTIGKRPAVYIGNSPERVLTIPWLSILWPWSRPLITRYLEKYDRIGWPEKTIHCVSRYSIVFFNPEMALYYPNNSNIVSPEDTVVD